MSDQHLLRDTVESVFAELGSATGADAWAKIEQIDLTRLLIAADDSGFGGSWDDARVVFRAAGYFALTLPVPESILAQYVGSGAGAVGRGTLASELTGSFDGRRFTGEIGGAVESEGAAFLVAPHDGGGLVVFTEGAERLDGVAMTSLRRDQWRFNGARAERVALDVHALGAFARACQIAGALDAALALTVAYANERVQFGRALGKFQALQQSLAVFACEAAAANCAVAGAAQALDAGGDGAFEIAAAKLRANRAVGVGTSVAHQTHGAIGFTQEYKLHQLTRRLWAWRSEFGGDAHCSALLGQSVVQSGADGFWSDLIANESRSAS